MIIIKILDNEKTQIPHLEKNKMWPTSIAGVYAVIPNKDKDQIILVQAPNGAWFLLEAEDHSCKLWTELTYF